jgi:DNA invertase Pin-like site-specific DNA recombinase
MSKVYGYARVSSEDQNLVSQEVALKAAGCDVILTEKASGGSRDGRVKLALLLEVIGEGDTVVVSRLDRLSRNGIDMLQIAEEIAGKGASLKSLNESWCNTGGAAGKLIFHTMAGVAQFFRDQSKERQKEGIAEAKKRGAYKGGVKRFDDAEIRRLHFEEGKGPTEIRDIIGAKSTMTVYRAIGSVEQ